MIAKKISMRQANLSSFEGLVNYLSSSQGVANRVGKIEMHNYESAELQWAIQETLAVQDQNRRSTSDKTYHLMVSLAAGEYLDDEQLGRIEKSMVEALGYAEHQRVSVVHRDTDHLHFHVAINKVHPEKKTIHEPFNDFKILGRECRKFEDEFGLQKVERGGGKSRSIDMEEVAGIESLIGWIRRECGAQLQAADSWGQVHKVLGEHGLILKPRGNGFIISDGNIHVKASSVEREFSKAALEKRLGGFIDANGEGFQSKKNYHEKPLSTVNVDLLFQQYREEKDLLKMQRQEVMADLAAAREAQLGAISAKYAFRRSLIKHSGTGVAKRILYKMLFRQMRREMQAVRADYAQRSKAFYVKNKNLVWADWLKKQAREGDAQALEALRKRGKKADYRGNRFFGQSEAVFAEAKIDTVTKKGTIIYAEDAMTIRDTGSVLKLAAIPDDRAVARALEIALARYGSLLNIGGTKHFQDKVARVAAARGMSVTFTDPKLNHRYQQYLKEHEYVRKHINRHRSLDGDGGPDGRGRDLGRGGSTPAGRRGSDGGRPVRYRWHGDERGRNRRVYAELSVGADQKLAHIRGVGSRRKPDVAQGGNGLRGMSERSLVRLQNGTEVLLPGDVPRHLEQRGSSDHQAVRRTAHWSGRVATITDIRRLQAVVGLVAKPGTRPPSFRRGRLGQVQSLPALKLSQPRAAQMVTASSVVPKSDVMQEVLQPIDKYIRERQDKIEKGFDIVNHRRYNPSDAGTLLFKGIRTVEGQNLALLKPMQAEEILVIDVTPYAAGRLKKAGLDTEVRVSATGQVRIVKNRKI